jgi:hypothetical protein
MVEEGTPGQPHTTMGDVQVTLEVEVHDTPPLVLATLSRPRDDSIVLDELLAEINASGAARQHNARVSGLFLPVSCGGLGSDIASYTGRTWASIPRHAVRGAETASPIIKMHARLANPECDSILHLQSILNPPAARGERDEISEAGTPMCVVDPQRQTVPLKTTFRVRKFLGIGEEDGSFTADIYLDVRWLEDQAEPLSRANTLSGGRPRSPSAIDASPTPKQRFDPNLCFENLVSPLSWNEAPTSVLDRNPSSITDMQQLWHGVTPDMSPQSFKIRRQVWEGVATFALAEGSTYPFDLTRELKISLRCRQHPAARIVLGQTLIAGQRVQKVKRLAGRPEFTAVDVGGPEHMPLPVPSEAKSLSFKTKKEHTLVEVMNKADAPRLDLVISWEGTANWCSPLLVLPSALLSAAAACALLCNAEGRMVAASNFCSYLAMLSVFPRFASPVGLSVAAQQALHYQLTAFLLLTVMLVATDNIVLLVTDSTIDQLSAAVKIAIAAGFAAVWGAVVATAASPRLLRCCLGKRSRDLAAAETQLPKELISMAASLLHTQWRKDRQREFSGLLVPRWKPVQAREVNQWRQGFEEKDTQQFYGAVYAEVPVAKGDTKKFLESLQKISDENRRSKGDAAVAPIDEATQFQNYKSNSRLEILDAVRQYTDQHGKQPDKIWIVDINNDFKVLPPSWQEENIAAARGSLEICCRQPDWGDDELADDVHKQWLSRNSWAKGGSLDVPFEQLSPVEQAKDMSQVLTCQLVLGKMKELRSDFYNLSRQAAGPITAYGDQSEAVVDDDDDDEDSVLLEAKPDAGLDITGVEDSVLSLDSFDEFVVHVLPDMERMIAHELFGKDMISVVEQIRRRKSTQKAGHHGVDDGAVWSDVRSQSSGTGTIDSFRAAALSGTISSLCHIEAGNSGYHIFISYRRTGVDVARSVKQSLEKLGYNCFMDFESLTAGDFQDSLEEALSGTPVVVVCLTPGSLTLDARWPGGGRAEPAGSTDYLLREVELALQMKKLIVPVRSKDFDIVKEFVATSPSNILALRQRNIVELNQDYWDASISKINDCIRDRNRDKAYIGDAVAGNSPRPVPTPTPHDITTRQSSFQQHSSVNASA